MNILVGVLVFSRLRRGLLSLRERATGRRCWAVFRAKSCSEKDERLWNKSWGYARRSYTEELAGLTLVEPLACINKTGY